MAWAPTASNWKFHDPVFESDLADPVHRLGPWHGHRWFMYDLVRWGNPANIVFLGPGPGLSLFAAAQAIKDAALSTRVIAIDSWTGEIENRQDIDDGFQVVERVMAKYFSSVDFTARRSETVTACGDFAEDAIDLLHIQDLPRGSGAQRYVDAWLPKLRDNGLLLIHDVERENSESAAVVRDMVARYGGFVFPQSYGLAVIAPKGTLGWDQLLARESVGEALLYYPLRANAFLQGVQLNDHVAMVEERDELVKRQDDIIADRDRTIGYLVEKVDEQEALLRASQLAPGGVDDPIQMMHLQQLNSVIANQTSQLAIYDSKHRALKARNKQLTNRLKSLTRQKNSPRVAIKVLIKQTPPRVARKARTVLVRTKAAVRAKPATNAKAKAVGAQRVAAARSIPEFGASQLNQLRANFDGDFYAKSQNLPSRTDAWDHYLNVGLPSGAPISLTVAKAVERSATVAPDTSIWESVPLTEGMLYRADGSVETIPLPHDDLSKYGNYVTFDLWDTLIERVRPPDAAKLATARRIKRRYPMSPGISRRSEWDLMAERVALEAEIARSRPSEEYRANEVLGLLIARYCPGEDAIAAADELVAEEVAEEIRYSRPRGEFPGGPPGKAAIVSDFYLDAADLRAIVAGVRPEWADVALVSSCEVDKSKRIGGELLDLVRANEGISVNDHLHVGDNLHSDVNMQLATGGAALHVPARVSPYPGPGSLTPQFATDLLELWPSYVASQLGPPSSPAQQSGRRWSFLPGSLVMGATEAANAAQAKSVFYLSREGVFLQQVHKAMAAGSAAYADVEPVHLAVSRRATFGPSLASLSINELMRLWSMYGSQSIEGLLLSLGVTDPLPSGLLARHGLEFQESVGHISNDKRMARLLADDTFSRFVWERLQAQRALLAQFLRQAFARESGTIIVSDVGWRGTIQDNIGQVIARPTHGVYLGLFPFLNPQSAAVRKSAVAFDGNHGHPFGYLSPPAAIERPWTPHEGSAIRYARGQRPGEVIPVLEASETHATPAIGEFQSGVLEAAPIFADWLESLGIMSSSLSEALRAQLQDYYTNPDPVIADIWFDSDHDDTFGAVGHDHIYAKPRPSKTWFETENRAKAAFEASGWPAGFSAWTPVRTLTTGLGGR